MLEWTFSPYVALHFATANAERFDVDGAIWCIDFVAANNRLPERLRRLLDEEGANTFSAEMLDGAAPTLEAFDALAEDDSSSSSSNRHHSTTGSSTRRPSSR